MLISPTKRFEFIASATATVVASTDDLLDWQPVT
jgi:hypothetical protein